MFNLENTTFIIPLFIESKDRYNNAKTVLEYLNKHFKTSLIIHEFINDISKLDFLDKLTNLNIQHMTEVITEHGVYHRTRQLNEMLNLVKTPVVCNYDIDVILPVESYILSQYLLSNSIFDVVYPYGYGKYQYQVDRGFDRKKFNKDFNIKSIENNFLNKEISRYGHCIFFRTDKYKSIGGENEEFISYGPEDSERYERCVRFNLNLHRIEDFVYHLEHSRTEFSNSRHRYYNSNSMLYERIKNMKNDDFTEYYSSLDYIKKYQFSIQQTTIVFNFPNPVNITRQNVYSLRTIVKSCLCGEPKDTIRYNFCQKCNRLY